MVSIPGQSYLCQKHNTLSNGPSCLHCDEDDKILEEKIGITVRMIERLSDAMSSSQVHEARANLHVTLRELIREVRRR